jgi:hypothetical protein
MTKRLIKWLWKTASDLHNVAIYYVVSALLGATWIGTILKSTKKALEWKLELWKAIVFSLLILLIYEIARSLLALKKPKINIKELKQDAKLSKIELEQISLSEKQKELESKFNQTIRPSGIPKGIKFNPNQNNKA